MAPGAKVSPLEEAEDEQIGEWTVERELARGGMGVVYLGHRNTEKAAIKVMLQTNGSVNQRKVKRFLREIDATSKLLHPGIVRILDSGEFRGYPFFAMEFVEGKPLDRMLKDDLDLEIGMEILEKMARAVHYAHEQGVIHRDLKPANVMVRDDMEPKLTDFGLAKDKDHQSVLTKTGAVLGTPYYLSPEQASGRSKNIDRRADVYSLGVIMYELATGRLPFVGQTTVELYNRIIHDDPVPPSKIKPQLTKALETVCLKAMAKDVDDRYATADAFADDIAALLQGGTIKAKPDGRIKRWYKRVKKRGSLTLILVGTAVLLTLVLGGLIYRFKSNEAVRHLDQVQLELDGLKASSEETIEAAQKAIDKGRVALRQNHLPDALAAANQVITSLDDLEAKYGALKFPENKPAAAKVADGYKPQQVRLRASALVLRAHATMYRDQPRALERAQKDLSAVLDEKEGIRPGDLAALVAQGDILVLKGNLNDSLQQYDLALKALPTSVRALSGKARVLIFKEELEEGISHLSQALDILEGQGPKPKEPAEGEDAKPPETEVIGDEEKKELTGMLLVERAQARLAIGGGSSLKKALADARAAGKALPDGWQAKATIGTILAHMGHAYEAGDAFDAAIALAEKTKDGSPAGPHIAKAEGLLLLGMPGAALASASTAVSRDPSSLLALVVRAEAEEQRLNYEEAEGHAESVGLGARKRHWRIAARAARVLARLEAAKGNVAEALGHAKAAHGHDDFTSDGRILLARLQLDPYFEGQYVENAERLLKKVQRQRSNSLAAKRALGMVLLQKFATDPKRAHRKFEEALALDPFDPWTLSALGRVFSLMADRNQGRAKTLKESAQKRYLKAARFERDVRRPAGLAYAVGLRAEKEANRTSGKRRAQMIREAQTAYQRAAWLDPTHAHALTGLASLAMLQNGYQRAGKHLKKASDANPHLVHTAVLNAFHLATVDGVDQNAAAATDALTRALSLRGETVDLVMRKIFLDTITKKGAEDLDKRIADVTKRFKALRARDPLNLAILKGELELLQRLATRFRTAEKIGLVRTRIRKLSDERSDMEAKLATREEEAKKLRDKAKTYLAADDELRAAAQAKLSVRRAPWNPEGWLLLAKARDKGDSLWGALAAGMRAAYIDDAYLSYLFTLLRRAGTEPPDVAKGEVAKILQQDVTEIYPIEKGLEKLMVAAPLVARAIVPDVRVDPKEAKQTFSDLEEILNHDPTKLIAHAMLGALTFGVRKDDYAIQHLLFVCTVRKELGEAAYLAGVAAARHRTKSRRMDVLAIECLKKASRAGFKWRQFVPKEKGLVRLKASALWKRLDEKAK